MADLNYTLTKVALTQENIILPRLTLFAEGHETLPQRLESKSRVEKLEDEVDRLKTVIRALSKEVTDLKKAQ